MKKKLIILLFLPLLFTACEKDNHSASSNWSAPTNNTENDTTNIESNSTNLTAQIYLEVSGFQNLNGNLAIVINNSSEQFSSDTQWYKDTTVNVSSDNIIILIKDMIAGTYAVSLFHDENINGELDLGFLNIPKEGFGFSNNPTILFSQPDFNDCKFTIENGDSISIPIVLVYL